jgi:hypothetical protein
MQIYHYNFCRPFNTRHTHGKARAVAEYFRGVWTAKIVLVDFEYGRVNENSALQGPLTCMGQSTLTQTDLVDLVCGRVRQNLAVNIVELDKAWVTKRLCLKERKPCVGLLPANIPV